MRMHKSQDDVETKKGSARQKRVSAKFCDVIPAGRIASNLSTPRDGDEKDLRRERSASTLLPLSKKQVKIQNSTYATTPRRSGL